MQTKLRETKKKNYKKKAVTSTDLKELFPNEQLQTFMPSINEASRLIVETMSQWIAENFGEQVKDLERKAKEFPGSVILQMPPGRRMVIVVHDVALEKKGAHSYIDKLKGRRQVVVGSFEKELAEFILPALNLDLDTFFSMAALEINGSIKGGHIDANDKDALKEEVLTMVDTIDEFHPDWIPPHRYYIHRN